MRRSSKRSALGIVILGSFIGVLAGFAFTWQMFGPGSSTAYAQPVQLPAGLNSGEVQSLEGISDLIVKAAGVAKPAVVYIEVERWLKQPQSPFMSPFYDPFFDFFHDFGRKYKKKSPKRKLQGLGSGFVVDADNGYIITNNHVIAGAEKIKVTLAGGKKLNAEVVGVDPKTDIGVIKLLDFKPSELGQLSFADSDEIKIGQWAIAVGNPFGLKQTVTFGIVSAKGRANINIAEYEDFIQTDAAINPGNSGGPLLNIHGKVMGMNTAIFSKSGGYQGIGFAVPANMIKAIMRQLVSKGKIERGFLGVYIQELNDEVKKHFDYTADHGILITEVTPDSPAEAAGVKPGDIIMSLDGVKVTSPGQLKNIIGFTAIGKSLNLKIFRDNVVKSFKLKVMHKNKGTSGDEPSLAMKRFGLSVINAKGKSAYKYGALVKGLNKQGGAATAGLRKGDIILKLNRVKVKDVKHFNAMIKKSKDSGTFLFLIDRDGHHIYFVVNL